MHAMLNGMVVQSCSKLCVVDYLASISGSLLWMKSRIHWCSDERSKKSWKDFWYRSSSLTRLLREDAMAHNLPKKKKKKKYYFKWALTCLLSYKNNDLPRRVTQTLLTMTHLDHFCFLSLKNKFSYIELHLSQHLQKLSCIYSSLQLPLYLSIGILKLSMHPWLPDLSSHYRAACVFREMA